MSNLILCEGKTDAILLGYYLAKVAKWTFSKVGPNNLNIKEKNTNENIAWYNKEGHWLMICAVGGRNNFESFFVQRIKNTITRINAFSRIAVVVDKDDNEIEEIENEFKEKFSPFFEFAENGKWKSNTYLDDYKIENTIESLLLIIPAQKQGALETVMLDAISEDTYDKNIVDKCKEFVNGIRPEATRYISNDRLQLKANLSTVWAIQTPEKVFHFIDERIKEVDWERYETLRETFNTLEIM